MQLRLCQRRCTSADWLPLVCALGAINLIWALRTAWDFPFDYTFFYGSARAFWQGEPLYTYANLNTPIAVLLLTPLGLLPMRAGWLLWQALNLAAFVWTLRLAGARPSVALVTLLVLHASTVAHLQLAQLAWLLGLPLALGWRNWRDGKWARAGAWLGIVVAIKPILLVLAFMGGPRFGVAALGSAGALTALGLAVLGLEAHVAYLGLHDIAWEHTWHPLAASLTGVLYQAGVPKAWSLALAALVWVPVVWRWRALPPDAQWLAALASALLCSPLGWVYYQAWLIPAALALGRLRLLWWGCLPPVVATAFPALQPVYLVSLVILWVGALCRPIVWSVWCSGASGSGDVVHDVVHASAEVAGGVARPGKALGSGQSATSRASKWTSR
jgi:hypothetical protein